MARRFNETCRGPGRELAPVATSNASSGVASAGALPYIHRTGTGLTDSMTTITEITDNFELLDEWDDRYRYVIELGRTLAPLSEAEHSEANKVQGCTSQVWLTKQVERDATNQPVLTFRGDSDAHIVRGLIAILLALYSGHTAKDILDIDAMAVFERLGFREHLTPQRSNGLRSMVERVRAHAGGALEAA